ESVRGVVGFLPMPPKIVEPGVHGAFRGSWEVALISAFYMDRRCAKKTPLPLNYPITENVFVQNKVCSAGQLSLSYCTKTFLNPSPEALVLLLPENFSRWHSKLLPAP